MLPIEELCAKLIKHYDADLLLEELQISARELLERFEDKVEIHYYKLLEAITDESE